MAPPGYVAGAGTHKEQLLAAKGKKWKWLSEYKPLEPRGALYTTKQLPNVPVSALPDYFPDWKEACPTGSCTNPKYTEQYRDNLAAWFFKWAPNCKCPYDPSLTDMSLELMQVYYKFFLAFFQVRSPTRQAQKDTELQILFHEDFRYDSRAYLHRHTRQDYCQTLTNE